MCTLFEDRFASMTTTTTLFLIIQVRIITLKLCFIRISRLKFANVTEYYKNKLRLRS